MDPVVEWLATSTELQVRNGEASIPEKSLEPSYLPSEGAVTKKMGFAVRSRSGSRSCARGQDAVLGR